MKAVCAACGSENIEPVEYGGPAGVVAPDGSLEMRLEGGVRCRDCGAVKDMPEYIEEPEVEE